LFSLRCAFRLIGQLWHGFLANVKSILALFW